MKVMVFVKATPNSEAETLFKEPEKMAKMFAEMGRYNEELVKAGIMKGGDGLKPSKYGKRIRFNGTKRSVMTAHSPRPRSSSRASGSGK